MAESIWRLRAREVINDTLAAMPPSASETERRLSVRNAYPFGSRENHPYRIWLDEVSKIMGPRHKPRQPKASVVLDTESGDLHVAIWCDYCQGMHCLGCFALRKRMEAMQSMTDWKKWLEWIELIKDGDPLTRAAFADWLEEIGWPEESARIRSTS